MLLRVSSLRACPKIGSRDNEGSGTLRIAGAGSFAGLAEGASFFDFSSVALTGRGDGATDSKVTGSGALGTGSGGGGGVTVLGALGAGSGCLVSTGCQSVARIGSILVGSATTSPVSSRSHAGRSGTAGFCV